MGSFFRSFTRNFPTLLTAFLLALAIWALAVISTDPSVEQPLQNPVPITIISQDPSFAITNSLPTEISVVLKAPKSVWERINADPNSVRALLDLSGLKEGEHTLPVQIQIGYHPAVLVSSSVPEVNVELERIESRSLPVGYVTMGSPAPGYSLGNVTISPQTATVLGPSSLVNSVAGLQASLPLNNTTESLSQNVSIIALDKSGDHVSGVKITPATAQISQTIEQRGGYRTVVVKVPITGQLASGYRLNNITVNPPLLTVYSNDPQLVENLPGFIETLPVDLTGISKDTDIKAKLNMPQGIQMDGEESVQVHLGVSPLEGSLTFSNQMVEMDGLQSGYSAKVSPTRVDVIISGPLPLLNKLTANDVHVVMDLSGMIPGDYQKKPVAKIAVDGLQVDSILPDTLEVIISVAGTPTP
jgi:YbbR domain-containing protein